MTELLIYFAIGLGFAAISWRRALEAGRQLVARARPGETPPRGLIWSGVLLGCVLAAVFWPIYMALALIKAIRR